jgi:hypothetical protein
MDPITNRAEASSPARRDTPVPPRTADLAPETPKIENPGSLITDLSDLAAKAAASGPDIRADEVERGKRLLADPNYPSDEILDELSENLLRSDDFSASL